MYLIFFEISCAQYCFSLKAFSIDIIFGYLSFLLSYRSGIFKMVAVKNKTSKFILNFKNILKGSVSPFQQVFSLVFQQFGKSHELGGINFFNSMYYSHLNSVKFASLLFEHVTTIRISTSDKHSIV